MSPRPPSSVEVSRPSLLRHSYQERGRCDFRKWKKTGEGKSYLDMACFNILSIYSFQKRIIL
jgi:hypothetical protein